MRRALTTSRSHRRHPLSSPWRGIAGAGSGLHHGPAAGQGSAGQGAPTHSSAAASPPTSLSASPWDTPSPRLTAAATQRALREVAKAVRGRHSGGALDLASLFAAAPRGRRSTAAVSVAAAAAAATPPPPTARVSLLSTQAAHTAAPSPPHRQRRTEKESEGTAARPERGVTPTLLAKLIASVAAKAIGWSALRAAHPAIDELAVMAEREYWTTHYARLQSATPLPDAGALTGSATHMGEDGSTPASSSSSSSPLPPPAVMLCAADTGTGKSVLVPLFLLDAHWRTLADTLRATAGAAAEGAAGASPLPTSNLHTFTRAFRACSRVCIVVCQPTRVACVEMATFTATLLSRATPSPAHEQAAAEPTRTSSGESHDQGPASLDGAAAVSLLGKRVGYAVGSESCFCAETEIVFATPGYVLNALQHARPQGHPGGVLLPTSLIIDEAHCRELETDLLLAWVKRRLEDTNGAGAGGGAWPPLRQVAVMSATMDTVAMVHYLQSGSVSDRFFQPMSCTPRAASGAGAAPRTHVHVMTFADQRRQLQALTSTSHRGEPSGTTAGAVDSTEAAWLLAKQQETLLFSHNQTPSRRSASLSHGGRDCGGAHSSPFTVEAYFLSDLTTGFLRSHLLFAPWEGGAGPLHHTSGGRSSRPPHRRQQTRTSHTLSLAGASPPPTPALLTADGERTLLSLQQLFSERGLQRGILHYPQAQAIASFALELLQAVRLRWGQHSAGVAASTPTASGPTLSRPRDPLTVLLFLPGFGEMQMVLQCLERRCSPVASPVTHPGLAGLPHPPHPQHASLAGLRLGGEPLTVLQYGDDVFSVPVLHAAAVGSPQEHLAASAAADAPALRLVLATSVAESSLTIPNVRVVLDTATSRRLYADPVTGTTLVRTTLASPGSLRQRRGRTGRTCDGVVIHLAPRGLFLNPPVHPHRLSAVPGLASEGRREGEGEREGETRVPSSVGAVPLFAEPPQESARTTLLRVKALFPGESATRVLTAMPVPPNAAALETALQLLIDDDLLVPAPAETYAGSCDATKPGASSDAANAAALYTVELQARVDGAMLSAKGRVVAALPIPLEYALFTYHALRFACVEEAVLIACAMTAPSLFLPPRVSPRRSLAPGTSAGGEDGRGKSGEPIEQVDAHNFSPLEQYYKHLWVQRQLAGFPVPTRDGDELHGEPLDMTNEAAIQGGAHLSEPLVLRALMQRWYMVSSGEEIHLFVTHLGINRSALRGVDVSVAQCCQRLIQLLTREEAEQQQQQRHRAMTGGGTRGTERAVHAHHRRQPSSSAGEPPSTSPTTPPLEAAELVSNEPDATDAYVLRTLLDPDGNSPTTPLLDGTWSPDYRLRLVQSLRRLRRAALARAGKRSGAAMRSAALPQWSSSEHTREHECARHVCTPAGALAHPVLARRIAQDHARARAVWHAAKHSSSGGGSGGDHRRAGAGARDPPMPTLEACARQRLARAPPRLRLGSVEDRLCAAYVAAFARQTMRGEDGAHRRHYRRLIRNGGALEEDVEHTCTFPIDTRATPGGGPAGAPVQLTREALTQALEPYVRGAGLRELALFATGRTAAARFRALGFPGLLPSSREPSVASLSAASAHTPDDSAPPPPLLLEAVVVPYERGAAPVSRANAAERRLFSGGHPLLHLAPFGVSLLTAAHHALQHIPVEVPVGSAAEAHGYDTVDTSHNAAAALLGSDKGRGRSPGEAVVVCSSVRAPPPCSSPPRPQAHTDHDSAVTADVIAWEDRLGLPQRLRRADVEALGLGHLLPPHCSRVADEVPALSSRLLRESGRDTEDRAADDAGLPAAHAGSVADAATADAPTTAHILLSVRPPVSVSGGVHWRIGLPSVAALWQAHHARDVHARAPRPQPPPAPGGSGMLFCEVCHTLLVGSRAMEQHRRSPAHLSHLLFSIAHGITHGDWMAIRTGVVPEVSARGGHSEAGGVEEARPRSPSAASPSSGASTGVEAMASLVLSTAPTSYTSPSHRHHPHSKGGSGGEGVPHMHTPAHSVTSPVTMESHPCRTASLSFLNSLQWHSQGNTAPPLAVAGGLVSSTATSLLGWEGGAGTSSPAWSARRHDSGVSEAHTDPAMSIDALFDTHYGRAAAALGRSAGPRPPTLTAQHVWVLNLAATDADNASTALLTLCGYVSSSSRQHPVSLLLNAAHTHAHGIMLVDRGVWRLPAPLPVRRLLQVLEHLQDGGSWPGMILDEGGDGDGEGAVGAGEGRTEGSASTAAGDAHEGLHWCSVCEVCPWPLPLGRESGPTWGATPPDPYPPGPHSECRTTAAETGIRDTVAAAVLLTLGEYIAAQRNMIVLADFVERLLTKLSWLPPPTPSTHPTRAQTSPAPPTAGRAAAGRLIQFLHARGQTLVHLLRELGCQFAAPPVAILGLLEQSAGGQAGDTATVATGMTAEEGKARDEEGAGGLHLSVETRFTAPPILPSRLPAPGFTEALRARHGRRGGAAPGASAPVRF